MPDLRPVLGPDATTHHAVVTYKLPGDVFETMIWRGGRVVPIEEWQNETWNDAIMAHAVAYECAMRLEKRGKMWSDRWDTK